MAKNTAARKANGSAQQNASVNRQQARGLLAQQQRSQQRRRLFLRVGAPLAIVALVVAILIAVKLAKPGVVTGPGGALQGPITSEVMDDLTSVPASASDTIAAGGISSVFSTITGTALTADGKPRVLYIGAEYCPYCGAERWPMVVALSRFGTFTGLGMTYSASNDAAAPNTPTLSFHGASYTSDYLSFSGYEQTTNQPQGNGYAPLDTVPAADLALMAQYDSGGTIPFVDFGNKLVIHGASYDPTVLAGLSQPTIAKDLADPSSAVAKSIVGTANIITAGLCTLTDQKPTAVCGAAGGAVAAATLPKT